MSSSPLTLAAKRAISRVYHAVGPRTPGSAVRCLMYHSIVAEPHDDPAQMTTPVSLFATHMAYLAAHGYAVTDAAEVVGRLRGGEPIAPKTIVITFDDGFVDTLDLAMPILAAHGFPATVFLVTSALDGRYENMWGGASAGYLRWDQARELLASGLMKAGCHSATHRNLRTLSAAARRDEIEGARRQLEDGLGVAIDLFAYPFGGYDTIGDDVRKGVEHAGFAGAFATVFGANPPGADRFRLKRWRVSWCERLPEFARLLDGAYDWYAVAQRLQALRA